MVSTKLDLIGRKFGRLSVLNRDFNENHRVRYVCQCDCGEVFSAFQANLLSGNTTSCGCARVKHGMSGTKVYSVWRQMRQRCENPNDAAYQNYGGRGIKVDDRWQSFDMFFDDMGSPPRGWTLDRVNNDGPYSKANCKWSSWNEQASNRRSNRVLKAFGRVQTIQQWATEYNLPLSTLKNRIDQAHLEIEAALTMPIARNKPCISKALTRF